MDSEPNSSTSRDKRHSSPSVKYYVVVVIVVFLAFTLLYSTLSYRPTGPYNMPTPLYTIHGMAQPETEVVSKLGSRYKVGGRCFEMLGSLSNSEFIKRIEMNGFKCGSELENTNLTTSKVYVNNVNENTGKVEIVIETFNHLGMRKAKGGDVIVVWAEENAPFQDKTNRKLIAGSVVDNFNGTYTGKLVIRLTGKFTIFANVLSLYRTQCLRFKAMKKYGNSVFSLPNSYGIAFSFRKDGVTDITRCSPTQYVYGYSELCNFTSLNLNYSYYCGKPSKGLACSDFVTNNMMQYNLDSIGMKRFKDDIIFDPGWGNLKQSVTVSLTIQEAPKWIHKSIQEKFDTQHRNPICCFDKPKRSTWNSLPSHMFINNGLWDQVFCKTKPFTEARIRECLSNKKVFFIGDSTIRQYVEVIGEHMGERVEYFDFYVTLNSIKDNINITWRKHELPFHNMALRNPRDTNSTENQIKNIANDETINQGELILGLTYNTHLQAFPFTVFRDRIRKLVKALEYLFTKMPDATVLFKGPPVTSEKVKWFDARISLLYEDILKEEFTGLKDRVVYLDAFTISVLNNNQDLHPKESALYHQVQQLIAYACP